jgi:hypothetical protein
MLNFTYNEVGIGKHLFGIFHIQNGLKQHLSQLFFERCLRICGYEDSGKAGGE